MKEIPIKYIRANQTGMVLLIIIAILAKIPVLIMALLIIEIIGLAFGLKNNLFVQISKPFLDKNASFKKTEALEITRFNNTLAVLFLFFSTIFFILGMHTTAYIISGILAVVILFAINGFCFGCFLYYQIKKSSPKKLS
jgi:hypothetical protein